MGIIFQFHVSILNLLSAVVNALKNLQRKINQMELERTLAQTQYQQLSHEVTNRRPVSSPYVDRVLPAANQPGPDSCNREGDEGGALFPYVLLRDLLFKSAVYVDRIYLKVEIRRGSM